MAKRKVCEWVKATDGSLEPLGFVCERCGARVTLTAPVPIEDYCRYAGVFEKRHRGCEEKGEGESVKCEVPKDRTDDVLYERVVRLVLTEQRCSVSMLQRLLDIGYVRASCMVNRMVSDGLLARYDPLRGYRQKVLMTLEQWEARKR